MKQFKFPLETVLTYKQQILETLQIEHAGILAQVRQQEAFLERLWKEYYAYGDEYRTRCEEGLPITEAWAYQAGLRAREREIQKETERLEGLRKKEEAKREEVVSSKKDTSTLEKLKDKQWGAYRASAAKREELMVEEFVMSTRSHTNAETVPL